MASAGDWRFWLSPCPIHHSPQGPSLRPPVIGVNPAPLSLSHASRKASQVCGGLSGSRPAFSNICLLYTHNIGTAYQPSLYCLPSKMLSVVALEDFRRSRSE